MSQELLEIYKTMNPQEVETKLALQCAPLLSGIKVSNLLNTDRASISYVKKLFKHSPISTQIIYETENKVTFLLYQKQRLQEYLNQKEVQTFMNKLGYSCTTLSIVIEEFVNRYHDYKKGCGSFPHEMGLLLGYPAEDVYGFIKNNGKNYLHTGYWKVYSNPTEAIHLFNRYKQAQERLVRMVSQGHSILDIINFESKIAV